MNNHKPLTPETASSRPEKHLYHKVVKGGFWLAAMRSSQAILGLSRLFVVARLLEPEDFGLLGIAMLTIATLNTFTQTGFQAALIQKKEKPHCNPDLRSFYFSGSIG